MSYKKIITTGELGSFAVEDVLSQSDKVVDIIIYNNKLSDKQIRSLEKLKKDIKNNSPIEKLISGTDKDKWNDLLNLNKGQTWLSNSHHGLVISYFHRLLLTKTDYFKTRTDPYLKLKNNAVKDFIKKISIKNIDKISFDEILDGMLWGNKFDLVPPTISDKKELVCDERDQLKKFFKKGKLKQIDVLTDNIGQELFFDLLFACYVLDNKLADTVIFHLKNYPYNISDATKEDFYYQISELKKSKFTQLKKLGLKIESFIKNKKINTLTYPFTTLGYNRCNSSNVIKNIYRKSSLLITKGDFNYRKNIGWYYWEISDCYEDTISYLNCPLLCFRTIKNEILLGVTNTSVLNNLTKDDSDWWKKGVGGMISFRFPNTKEIESFNSSKLDDYWSEIYE